MSLADVCQAAIMYKQDIEVLEDDLRQTKEDYFQCGAEIFSTLFKNVLDDRKFFLSMQTFKNTSNAGHMRCVDALVAIVSTNGYPPLAATALVLALRGRDDKAAKRCLRDVGVNDVLGTEYLGPLSELLV